MQGVEEGEDLDRLGRDKNGRNERVGRPDPVAAGTVEDPIVFD